jgi:hypothetical protein
MQPTKCLELVSVRRCAENFLQFIAAVRGRARRIDVNTKFETEVYHAKPHLGRFGATSLPLLFQQDSLDVGQLTIDNSSKSKFPLLIPPPRQRGSEHLQGHLGVRACDENGGDEVWTGYSRERSSKAGMEG